VPGEGVSASLDKVDTIGLYFWKLCLQYLGITQSWEQLRSGTYNFLLWKYTAYKFLGPNRITGEESNSVKEAQPSDLLLALPTLQMLSDTPSHSHPHLCQLLEHPIVHSVSQMLPTLPGLRSIRTFC
jgi:hypothetical protein